MHRNPGAEPPAGAPQTKAGVSLEGETTEAERAPGRGRNWGCGRPASPPPPPPPPRLGKHAQQTLQLYKR